MIATTDNPAEMGNDALTARELNVFMDEIRLQPQWRTQANKEADYYDGNQLDSQTLHEMENLGMAPIIENLIGPTIDAVLGLEAKTRLDFRVTAANDATNKDMAEAMNVKLNEVERESRADRSCSDAYASEIKVGLGWVEVAKETDPFRYGIRASHVHRNEIFFDWRDKSPDLKNSRYLIRKQWFDADILRKTWPDSADLIGHVSNGWGLIDQVLMDDNVTGLNTSMERERGWSGDDLEWRDTGRGRVCLLEVWYRRWVRGYVFKLPDGRTIEYDKANSEHVRAVALGLVNPIMTVFAKMRLAWYVGPHCLGDGPSPYKHGNFPYVPFWGRREDLTNTPYGLVRPMVPMQDEINARNSKMVWLLAAKRVTATKGMVKNKETVRREVARPDAYIELEANQPSGSVFKVESDFQLNTQQFQALQDKRESIKNVAGVYNAMMGRESNAKSGIAIESLVEQGTTTLAEINDNYRYARAKVGELLLSLMIEDMGDALHEVEVDSGGIKKTVTLNAPRDDESGLLDNDIQRTLLKVALSDVPSTPSYRMQRLTMLTQLTQSLPPELQALIIDFVIASTDLPERDQIVDRLRSALHLQVAGANGQPGQPGPNGEDQQPTEQITPEQVQQAVQEAVQQALQQAGVALQERELAIKEKDAETRRMAAQDAADKRILDAVIHHA